MANQLNKFSPHLTGKTKLLQDLLSMKNHWCWVSAQEKALRELKESLSLDEVLAKYNSRCKTVISADASSYGLETVLRQKQPDGS